MDSLAFLDRAGRTKVQPVYVLHGDEDFLKRQVVLALRARLFGEGGDDFGLSSHSGDTATFAKVKDELETLPFLSPYRLVIVESADPFVTRHRGLLEKYVTQPAERGVLVLDVRSWPATTKLAKLVDPAGTLVCKAPALHRLPDWCMRWAESRHHVELEPAAAALLVDLVGAEMGQLDQELTKLAVYVGDRKRVTPADVDRLVGNSRTENTFRIFDALADGRPAEALAILGRQFDQGEEPLRMLAAFGLQLRRLAQAARLVQAGTPIGEAMNRLGVPPFARHGFERQLRHLGFRRARRLFSWLLEADSGLKGGSPLPPRVILERLLVRLAAKAPAAS
jgi:DNA polymerase-3 subunit delta